MTWGGFHIWSVIIDWKLKWLCSAELFRIKVSRTELSLHFTVEPFENRYSFIEHSVSGDVSDTDVDLKKPVFMCLSATPWLLANFSAYCTTLYVRSHYLLMLCGCQIQQSCSLNAWVVECVSCRCLVFHLRVSRESCFAREMGFWQTNL